MYTIYCLFNSQVENKDLENKLQNATSTQTSPAENVLMLHSENMTLKEELLQLQRWLRYFLFKYTCI